MTAEDENPGAARDTLSRADNDSTVSRTSGNAPGAGTRAKRTNRAPAVNAIQASRRHRKERGRDASALEDSAASASTNADNHPAPRLAAGPPAGNADRRESDPWTVPDSVRNRFVQDGNRFFFPDGAPAFKDLGRRLTTTSENAQVVHSLIQIAHSRGWSEITVSGTERFRQEAWRQARFAGLAVRGYRPTDLEQTQLIRAMARNLSTPASSRTDTISADPSPIESRAPSAPAAQAPFAMGAGGTAPDTPKGRIAGTLLDHGRDSYRHDPQEETSYFVSVQTPEGRREIWGKDLERAMTKSLTQPQVGDEVVLQKTGRDAVTVKRQERDGEGQVKQTQIETHRNRWLIEKTAFFDKRLEAAQVVRDASIDPRTAVREHPELAGTYLNLKAAELAARALRDAEDRRRFMALVRKALADDIERGEPLQPVRLRERASSRTTSDRSDRAPVLG
jgi:Large polyvalent protein-associated domain 7